MFGVENTVTFALLAFILIIPALRSAYFAPSLSQTESTSGRIPFFDFVRGIAILMVIVAHVMYFQMVVSSGGHETFLVLINNYVRFAIPVFIIASGALLEMPTRDGLGDFYKRKFFRVVLPYLIVSLILIGSFIFSLICNSLPALWYFGGAAFAGRFLFFFVYGMYHRNDFISRNNGRRVGAYPWSAIVIFFLVFTFFYPGFLDNARFFYGVAMFELLLLLSRRLEYLSSIGVRSKVAEL